MRLASIGLAQKRHDWTVQEVWFFPVSGTCHILYGQTVYGSKADAIIGITTETKIRNAGILDGAILRAYLVLEEGCTDLTDNANAEIREAKAGAGGSGGGGETFWSKDGTDISPATPGDDILLNTGETLSITDMTTGSIPFIGASGLLLQDNSNLFWDNVNKHLGVDTPTPDSAFHIKANTPGTIGSHPAGQLIIQSPNSGATANVVIAGYESDGAGNPEQQLWYAGSSSGSNYDITFLNRYAANLTLGTTGVSRFIIDAFGNVGIGTTTPSTKLEVNGQIGFGGHTRQGIVKEYNASTGDMFGLEQVSGPQSEIGVVELRLFTSDVGSAGIGFGKYSDATTFAHQMVIQQDGNVGIGTTTPSAKLEVGGYTKLGSDAPAIKTKKLTGTTASTEGAFTAVAHGVTDSKILPTTACFIEYQTGLYMPTECTIAPGYRTHMNIQGSAIRIWNHVTDSENILNKPFVILMTYEE